MLQALKIRMGQASDLAQGWEERHKEFEDFEHKFEVTFNLNLISTQYYIFIYLVPEIIILTSYQICIIPKKTLWNNSCVSVKMSVFNVRQWVSQSTFVSTCSKKSRTKNYLYFNSLGDCIKPWDEV